MAAGEPGLGAGPDELGRDGDPPWPALAASGTAVRNKFKPYLVEHQK